VGLNCASVYTIVEYNAEYFFGDNRSNKEWPPSDAMLVSDIIVSFSFPERIPAVRRMDIIGSYEPRSPEMLR
jgi:hypothetical protein